MKNKFINLYIFSLIIVILNLSYINCSTITFNNNIISNCNISYPCDLSSRSVWLNNELPTDGDDVVIDLSTLKSESGVYLTVSSFHINLNSFTFNGQQSTYSSSSLIISNSNLTVSTEFNINNSNVTFYDDSNTNINISTFTSTLSNVITNGTCYLNIGTFNGVSGSLTVSNSSYLAVSGNATVNVYVMHTSDNLLSFMGTTLISSQFYSLYVVQFKSQTTFTHSATLNVTFVSDQVIIKNASIVSFGSYQQLTDFATIQVYESSSFMIVQPLIQSTQIINSIHLYNNSLLAVPSGFAFSNTDGQMNGTIYINDANYQTTFFSVVQPNLIVQTMGNVSMTGDTTLGYLSMANSSSLLEIRANVIITRFIINSKINLYFGSLKFLNDSTLNVINVSGDLYAEAKLYGSAIYVNPTGVVYGYNQIAAGVYCLSGSVSFSSDNSNVLSINVQQQGSLFVYYSFINVTTNLTIGGYSSIKFDSAPLNNNVPLIRVKGFVNIDDTTSYAITLTDSKLPSDGDKVLLISSNSLLNNRVNIEPSLVNVYSEDNQIFTGIKYSVEQDSSGNINLVFSSSDIDSSNKKKIGIIIGTIVGFVILVAIIVVIIKKRHHHHHHHHHHGHHEHSPLIH